MWREILPDQQYDIEVDGYNLVAYSFGTGNEVLLCLNGGPGLPCDYLRDTHGWLKIHNLRVVCFDQLGTGASDRPQDPEFWNINRYVEEVETVRRTLELGQVHMLGHSWGGWLAIEYAIHYPQVLKSLILENTVGDIPHLSQELERLRSALGSETIAMMQRHEAMGTLDHPQYQAAITLLNYRHVCRLDDWPEPLTRSLNDWNMGPYIAMQGPNEFLYTGNLKDWNRLRQMQEFNMPALITTGQYDELTPACAMRMKMALKDARLHVFPNSSHMPFYEEPEAYFAVLLDFLEQHRG